MRLCQFGDNRLGLVGNADILEITSVLDNLPSCQYPMPAGDGFKAALPALGEPIHATADGASTIPVPSVTLAQPGRQSKQDPRPAGKLRKASG